LAVKQKLTLTDGANSFSRCYSVAMGWRL